MSSMLEQELRCRATKRTAQRTAEEAVIEKYQSEIKEAVNAILEQEENGRGRSCRSLMKTA